MSRYVARTYRSASFLFDKQSQSSVFFEGSLAHFAPSLLFNPALACPDELRTLAKAPTIISDFERLRRAVRQFASLDTLPTTAPQVKRRTRKKSAMEELAAYAVKHWQVINASIELTHRCNQRCACCYLEDFTEHGLDRERLGGLACELRNAGAIFVLFTGGETFLRPDAMEIMEEFANQGLILEVKTNGLAFFNDRLVTRLADLQLLDLQVSVYGHDDGWSDFTHSQYPLTTLLDRLRLFKGAGVPVSVAVLVGKHNIDHLDQYHDKLRSTGIEAVTYSPYITPNRGTMTAPSGYRLSGRELNEKFLPFLKKIQGLLPPLRYRRGDGKRQPACYAGRDQVAIDPRGVVCPCLDLRLPLGNITREPLSAILSRRKKALRPFKLVAIPACCECDVRAYCDSCVGVALMENGDFRKPSQHKCDVSRFYYSNTLGKEVMK